MLAKESLKYGLYAVKTETRQRSAKPDPVSSTCKNGDGSAFFYHQDPKSIPRRQTLSIFSYQTYFQPNKVTRNVS
jgi:hypothetical protein